MDVQLKVTKDGDKLIAVLSDMNGKVVAKRSAAMRPRSMAEQRRMEQHNSHDMGPIAKLRGVVRRLCRDNGWNIV